MIKDNKILSRISALLLCCFFVFLFSCSLSVPVQAQTAATQHALKGLQNTANPAGLQSKNTLPQTIGLAIKVLLSVLGVVLLILMIYAGILYMTAGGDKNSVQKAKDMMIQAIIGLIIVLGAYAITAFIVSKLIEVVK